MQAEFKATATFSDDVATFVGPELSDGDQMETFFELDQCPVQSPLISTSCDWSNRMSSLDVDDGAAVQPKRQRQRTSAEQAKREKNNMASRTCRWKKKEKHAELERRVSELLDENQRLRKKRCKRCGALVVT